ncbi:hypothetical protein [Oenococcus oeni]|uniref:hypothetical protein n=1 Tax=Oenococcus oeni TaxID=1247 RepID=UPI0002979580|nr:hypothetical protein [Oenococcus oeni]EKP90036.1 hypothetical protein AWRIB129_471 [Oenococcus oeni DSM 20252 = AWRIB129]OIL18381.1 hypothetical protein ATW99_09425 [Oenococcus oeni]OIL21789.1 hypothetical protein ATX01_10140 [Oenococcus oeni]OIL40932.1 hypothetical protein ATX13_09390 [Oenococcus oeni]OIL46849.1 hypothetical protein ATX17_09265 [Oenococcus oeni]
MSYYYPLPKDKNKMQIPDGLFLSSIAIVVTGYLLDKKFLQGQAATLLAWLDQFECMAIALALISLVLMICLLARGRIRRYLVGKFVFLNLYPLTGHRLASFLYQAEAYQKSTRSINFIEMPDTRRARGGFEIESIGDLNEKLLSANFKDSLSAYLSRSGSPLKVTEAFMRGGWVFYRLERDFHLDQLEKKGEKDNGRHY